MNPHFHNLIWVIGYPISLLWGIGATLRRWFAGLEAPVRFRQPVYCVGNIHSGGSGKSPIVAELVKYFSKSQPAILSRGHKRRSRGAKMVDAHDPKGWQNYGDEPWMLSHNLGVPVVVSARRADAKKLLDTIESQIVIMDDGFQHFSIQTDGNVVLISVERDPVESFCPPLGDLREPYRALRCATAIALVGSEGATYRGQWQQLVSEIAPAVPVFDFVRRLDGFECEGQRVEVAPSSRVYAVCGIARPERFISDLERLTQVVGKSCFPDHHFYNSADSSEIEKGAQEISADYIVTTDKDYFKLANQLKRRLLSLKISYRIPADFLRLMVSRTCAGFALFFLLVRCASSPTGPAMATSTGIDIPPDVVVVVPTPQPSPEIKQAPKKEKKGKRVVVEKPTPTPIPYDNFSPDKLPFEIGERLEIDLGWMALPAGRAIVEVREGPVFNGRPTFHLWANALSSRLVDTIYHVDNTVETFFDRNYFVPYKYLLHMVESKQLKETRVMFDHPQKKAFFWSKRISERWGNEEVNRDDELVPLAKDLFSGLYYARTIEYDLNKKVNFLVYENGKNWEVELLPVANEFVRSKVGAFQCWKILVTVRIQNVLRPTGDIYMWLSDDSKKYIVKFDAKIKIGSLYGNLVNIREH